MLLTNWKIKDLIFFGFSIPTILVLGFSGMVYFTANQTGETFNKVSNLQNVIAGKQLMSVAKANMDRRMRRYFLDPQTNLDALEGYANDKEQFQNGFELAYSKVKDAEQEEKLKQMNKIYEGYVDFINRNLSENNGTKNKEELIKFFKDSKKITDTFDKVGDEFDIREKDILDKSLVSTTSTINLLILASVATSILSLAIATLATFLIAQFLGMRISKAVKVAEQISVGDLTRSIDEGALNGNDEVGQLLKAFQTMTQNLNTLIRQVQKSGIEVTTSSTQIAASGKQLETTMTEQVASTNEVTATAREISATSRELAKTMEEVALMSQTTTIAANSSQKNLLRMETSMRQLGEATNSIASRLGVISEKANSINNIVITITKVADQTNLLSLNAAIEAEKAGEFGLGFAVVAREIRRLADQTAVATLEIDKMVKQMQSSVSTGVMEMDKFAKEVGQSVEDVTSISTQVAEIIEQVQELTPRFEAVNQGMEAQSQGAQQISDAMVQLSSTSAQTTESLREINNAITQLNQVSHGLRQEISRFQVRTEHSTHTLPISYKRTENLA